MRAVIILISLLFAATSVVALPAAAAETVMSKIERTGIIKVAVRDDARPFSYLDTSGQPAGFTVDLCRAAIEILGKSLNVDDLGIEYLVVGAEDRFAAIGSGDADLLCGATTATLSRRGLVDFSIATYFDGASVIYSADGPKNFQELAGRKIGVRAGTTTEKALVTTMGELAVQAEILFVADHADGMARLEKDEIAAYFADRSILQSLLEGSGSPDRLVLSDRFFTHEPYALAMAKGDPDLRLAIDRALSHIYRSGEIEPIFKKSFGEFSRPSQVLQVLYLVSALPE